MNGPERPLTIRAITTWLSLTALVIGAVAAFYVQLLTLQNRQQEDKATLRAERNAQVRELRALALAQGAQAKEVTREQFNIVAVRVSDDTRALRSQAALLESRLTGLETQLATILDVSLRYDSKLVDAQAKEVQDLRRWIDELRARSPVFRENWTGHPDWTKPR